MSRTLWAAVCLLLLAGHEGIGQQAPLQPRTLLVSSNKGLGIPPFGFHGFAKSDQNGNIYVRLTEEYAPSAVLKISVSTSEPTLYSLSTEMRDKFNVLDFSVTPTGSVRVLTDTADHSKTVVFEFNGKGEVKGRIDFELPAGVNIYDFLASDHGLLLLWGLYGETAAKELKGHSFVGVFDETGVLVKKMNENLGGSDLSQMAQAPMERGATVGEDGSFYLLGSKQIVVLSPAAELVRRIPVAKPAAELRMAGLFVSGGLAAIRLAHLEKDHRVSFTFLVLDLSTRQTVGWYSTDPSIQDGAVAFSRTEGFTFYQIEQEKVHLVTARLR